jgi:hypothetical protein
VVFLKKPTANNKHNFSKGNNGYQISPRMQELMVYAGHLDSYQKCNEVIKHKYKKGIAFFLFFTIALHFD